VTENVVTGRPLPSGVLALTRETPRVTIGGVPAEVLFSGLAPGFVGLYQVNVRAPSGAPAGARTPLVVSIGGRDAPPAPIATN
jgi:uncharacterized protein (TIGR03437 family)